ncbi:MAG: transporter [Flavobacteriaceae bacterium]|nr:transporter [Flavobacteriaceae bacterium]
MKRFTLLAVLFLLKYSLVAQSIQPSRTVGDQFLNFDFESLYTISKGDDGKTTHWTIPNTLIRYGLGDTWEVHLLIPFSKQNQTRNRETQPSVYGLDAFNIGLAKKLCVQDGLRPSMVLMTRVTLPGGDQVLALNNTSIRGSLNFGYQLNNATKITTNIGYKYNPMIGNAAYYISYLTYNFNPQYYVYLELLGDFNTNEFVGNDINVGVGNKFTKKLCLALSVSKSTVHDSYNFGGVFTWSVGVI